MNDNSRAEDVRRYAFLVAFANDDVIDLAELEFMEKLVLEDRTVDDEERRVLKEIFERVTARELAPAVREEIARFRAKFGI